MIELTRAFTLKATKTHEEDRVREGTGLVAQTQCTYMAQHGLQGEIV